MKLDNDSFVGFHHPKEENGELSNWYIREFVVDSRIFTSVEQYMMYKKALMFHDDDAKRKILAENDPAIIKQIGREISHYNDALWSMQRQIIVYEGVKNKFFQNADLFFKLTETNGLIAECSRSDKVWGIGVGIDDPKRYDTDNWTGQNLLGGILMQVRKILRQKSAEMFHID